MHEASRNNVTMRIRDTYGIIKPLLGTADRYSLTLCSYVMFVIGLVGKIGSSISIIEFQVNG